MLLHPATEYPSGIGHNSNHSTNRRCALKVGRLGIAADSHEI